MNSYLAVVLVAALPAAALAQQEVGAAAPAEDGRTAPVLNGHLFSPSVLVDSPFRETTFKLGILYGFGKATGQKYDRNGPVPGETVDYTFAAFAQTFRYEYQFLDWLSAGVLAVTTLYSGIDGPSVVSVGAEVGVGAGARVKAGHQFGPVQTAIVFDVSSAPEYGFLVAAALIKAIQQGVIDAGSALQATHAVTVNPVLAAAWAPIPALGLTANVGYVYKYLRLSGGAVTTGQNAFQIGGVLDFDFGKVSSVPVAVVAGSKLITPLGDGGIPKIEDYSIGFSYTARRRLGLNLEIGRRDFTIREGLDSNGTLAQLGLQYYW